MKNTVKKYLTPKVEILKITEDLVRTSPVSDGYDSDIFFSTNT